MGNTNKNYPTSKSEQVKTSREISLKEKISGISKKIKKKPQINCDKSVHLKTFSNNISTVNNLNPANNNYIDRSGDSSEKKNHDMLVYAMKNSSNTELEIKLEAESIDANSTSTSRLNEFGSQTLSINQKLQSLTSRTEFEELNLEIKDDHSKSVSSSNRNYYVEKTANSRKIRSMNSSQASLNENVFPETCSPHQLQNKQARLVHRLLNSESNRSNLSKSNDTINKINDQHINSNSSYNSARSVKRTSAFAVPSIITYPKKETCCTDEINFEKSRNFFNNEIKKYNSDNRSPIRTRHVSKFITDLISGAGLSTYKEPSKTTTLLANRPVLHTEQQGSKTATNVGNYVKRLVENQNLFTTDKEKIESNINDSSIMGSPNVSDNSSQLYETISIASELDDFISVPSSADFNDFNSNQLSPSVNSLKSVVSNSPDNNINTANTICPGSKIGKNTDTTFDIASDSSSSSSSLETSNSEMNSSPNREIVRSRNIRLNVSANNANDLFVEMNFTPSKKVHFNFTGYLIDRIHRTKLNIMDLGFKTFLLSEECKIQNNYDYHMKEFSNSIKKIAKVFE